MSCMKVANSEVTLFIDTPDNSCVKIRDGKKMFLLNTFKIGNEMCSIAYFRIVVFWDPTTKKVNDAFYISKKLITAFEHKENNTFLCHFKDMKRTWHRNTNTLTRPWFQSEPTGKDIQHPVGEFPLEPPS